MIVIYSSEKVENYCTNYRDACKLFGGDKVLATSLLSRINDLQNEKEIRSIIVRNQKYRFHKLFDKGKSKLDGFFAIDVKSRKESWRIIICPLDKNKKEFVPCNIDQIMDDVVYLRIEEVSNHYE